MKTPKEIVQHGETRIDDYAWLRDKSNPEVLKHLARENENVDQAMKHTKELQEKLYDEILGRIKETDMGVPYRKRDYFYYSRSEKGKSYAIYCRKRAEENSDEEIFLDVNQLAENKEYVDLGGIKVSPDQKLLAYTVDYNGSERYQLYIKDLLTNRTVAEDVREICGPIVWANDNRTLFYKRLDETERPDRVFRHVIGTPSSQDVLVYHEPDQAYHVDVEKSRSEEILFIGSESKVTTEYHFLLASKPEEPPRLIRPRENGVEYYPIHHDTRFFLWTNENAPNFRVVETDISKPGKENWTEFLPYDPDRRVDQLEAFEKHLVIVERKKGLSSFRVVQLDDKEVHEVVFPEASYVVDVGTNREFSTGTFRFEYESPVTSLSVYDYDMQTRERSLLKQKEVLGGYDPSKYVVERPFAAAADGTKVPITLLRSVTSERNGKNPVLLVGYGAYEYPRDPSFNSALFSLVDRGFVYAIAHVRGGGEMGRQWYEEGKFLKKKNTFTDFIACAEHLIQEKYTSAGRIAAMGGSAGGLLMGAVTNMRPDLWGCVVAMVPFVDVLNTMSDPTLPLTITEYEEWGDPRDREYYDYIKSYSPYENVTAQKYPNILATAGLNDPRVSYWEPAKWVEKLKRANTATTKILLKTEMGTGHAGPSGRYKQIEELAFHYAYILDALGVSGT